MIGGNRQDLSEYVHFNHVLNLCVSISCYHELRSLEVFVL